MSDEIPEVRTESGRTRGRAREAMEEQAREETKMGTDSVEPDGRTNSGAAGKAVGHAVTVWRFARHLLEMVVAMMAGMAVLGVVIWALGEPPGYANLFVEYGLMGAFMSAPMVGWMRYRGHSWRDGAEMTAAMLVPTFALVAPVGLGVEVPGLSAGSLMELSHVAMLGGMVALMVCRFGRYAHGAHGRP